MTDRPILFSGPMVRALIEGRKTQTRRIIKPQPPETAYFKALHVGQGGASAEFYHPLLRYTWPRNLKVDLEDRLWVRESWRTLQKWDEIKPSLLMDDFDKIDFAADGYPRNPLWAWGVGRPSIFMPKWASRITLHINDVRIERLQDISNEDAIAEGIERLRSGRGYYDPTVSKAAVRLGHYFDHPVEAYSVLWDHIYGEGAWDRNPFVVAYTFRVALL